MEEGCYERGFNLLHDICKYDASIGCSIQIVHGVPTLSGGKYKGKQYGHCWLEAQMGAGIMCYDTLSGSFVPKGLYYESGRIEYSKAYTIEEAVSEALRTGIYGPWDEEVRKALHVEDV